MNENRTHDLRPVDHRITGIGHLKMALKTSHKKKKYLWHTLSSSIVQALPYTSGCEFNDERDWAFIRVKGV